MIIWLSRVGKYYYMVTWEDKKFITSSCSEGDKWEKERSGNSKEAISWIANSDIEMDVLIGETTW